MTIDGIDPAWGHQGEVRADDLGVGAVPGVAALVADELAVALAHGGATEVTARGQRLMVGARLAALLILAFALPPLVHSSGRPIPWARYVRDSFA